MPGENTDGMKVPRDTLRDALLDSIDAGHVTAEFARLAMIIAQGHLSKISARVEGLYSAEDLEDVLGAWSLKFIRKWDRMDPEKNLHSYITTMVANELRMNQRALRRRIRRESAKVEAAYWEQMDSISRFIRYHEGGLGDESGIVGKEEFKGKRK